MVFQEKLTTIDEFKVFVNLPENNDTLFELINGEIIDVSPGRTWNSQISHLLAVVVYRFCQDNNLPCYTSGGDGAYAIDSHVVAPDFAYKPTPMSSEYPDSVPPQLAVEVISPTDRAPAVQQKRQIYLKAGILYWEIYPDTQSIEVYAPGQPLKTLTINDTLDGGAVLPGFQVAVKDILPAE